MKNMILFLILCSTAYTSFSQRLTEVDNELIRLIEERNEKSYSKDSFLFYAAKMQVDYNSTNMTRGHYNSGYGLTTPKDRIVHFFEKDNSESYLVYTGEICQNIYIQNLDAMAIAQRLFEGYLSSEPHAACIDKASFNVIGSYTTYVQVEGVNKLFNTVVFARKEK